MNGSPPFYRQPRFWVIWLFLWSVVYGYHAFASPEAQNWVLHSYSNGIKPAFQALVDAIGIGAGVPDRLETVLQTSPGSAAATAILPIAIFICQFMPPRGNKHISDDVRAVKQANLPGPANAQRLVASYEQYGVRSAQGRCMISYALLSFAATEIFPATLPSMTAHLIALGAAAAIAAAWATQRPCEYFNSYPGFRLSFMIGCGGVFLAGLIAAGIALPYRMAPGDNSHLSPEDIQRILGLRLILLPIIGWLGSLGCLIAVRLAGGQPTKLRGAVD
jgi:hypothetical protein